MLSLISVGLFHGDLPLTKAIKSQKTNEDLSNESRAPSFLATSLAAEAADFVAKEKNVVGVSSMKAEDWDYKTWDYETD